MFALARGGEAAEALRAAAKTFDRLGARPALAETEELLLRGVRLSS